MGEFWDEAIFLLETLVMKAKGQDKDGMDLSFTAGDFELKGQTDHAKFRKALEDCQPRGGVHTDMAGALGNILDKHLKDLRHPFQRNHVKNLTVTVLTDGIWAGARDKDGVEKMIVSFLKELTKTIGPLPIRPVSIQFIQFGNDREATIRLQRLDEDLEKHGIPSVALPKLTGKRHRANMTNPVILLIQSRLPEMCSRCYWVASSRTMTKSLTIHPFLPPQAKEFAHPQLRYLRDWHRLDL